MDYHRLLLRYAMANSSTELSLEELASLLPGPIENNERSRWASVKRALYAHQATEAVVVRFYSSLAQRVRARYVAATKPVIRDDAVHDTHPVNKPRGIDPKIVRDNGKEMGRPDSVKPARKDIRPEDVFPGTPRQMGVLNFVRTKHDLSKALDKQVPKDKGYDAVSNLSQYLIETEGGGGAGSVQRK